METAAREQKQAGEGRTSEHAIGLLTDTFLVPRKWQCLVHAEGFAWGAQAGGDAHPGHTDLCLLASHKLLLPRKPEEHQKGEPVS